MKKKIIIILSTVLGLIAIGAIFLFCVKNSAWANEKSDTIAFTAGQGFDFYPDNEYNYAAGEYLEWYSDDYSEFVVEAKIEEGRLVFRIYDMNGYGFNEKDKYTIIKEEFMDETGTYIFSPSDLTDGTKYLFSLESEDLELHDKEKYVVAFGQFTRIKYKTNWEKLISKIGFPWI